MLPSQLRLSRKGFKEVLGAHQKLTPHFSVIYKKKALLGGSAVIVSKKVAHSSVERHLLKRRVRAILKTVSTPNQILIISARNKSNTLTFEQIKEELTKALQDILET
jgi:ribonuclease P protein component